MRKVVSGRRAPQNVKSDVKTNIKPDGETDDISDVKSDGAQSRLKQFVNKRTVTPGK